MIWTRIAVFISYGDNDYTTGTSEIIIVIVIEWKSEKAKLETNTKILPEN